MTDPAADVNPNSAEFKTKAATAYAKAGLFILELDHGSKEPVSGKGWKTHATNNPEVIAEMFRRNPDANWGACPGPHFVWLDLDQPTENKPNKANGREALALWELENIELPPTFTCRTPSGGEHRLYRVARPVTNANRLPAGVDTRGGHGYVVGPGSELVEGLCEAKDTPGRYAHVSGTLKDTADAPEELVETLRSPGQEDPRHDVPLCELDLPDNIQLAREFLDERDPAIMGQGGDGWTIETAMFLRDFGISEDLAYTLMETTGWNGRCLPRWSASELKTKIANGYRYSENRPGCKRDRSLEMQALRKRQTREELDYIFVLNAVERARYDAKAKETNQPLAVEVEPLELAADDPARPFDSPLGRERRYYYAGGFMRRGRRREYVIPGWLPAHGMTAVLAARGVGKSTVLIDLACRIAHKMDWQGIPTMAESEYGQNWKVLYLCGEDDEGLELNILGWHKFYGKEPNDRLIIRDGVPDLLNADDVMKEIEAVQGEVEDDCRLIVIVDTWQRATSRGKQSADDEMNKAIENVEFIAERNNGPVLVAFHPPKAAGSQTILGSSFIENATSAIWWLEEVTEGVKMEVLRIKGPGHGNWRKYRKTTVALETVDAFGKPEIGLVPVKFAGTEVRRETTEKQANKKREALARLVRVAVNSSLTSQGGPEGLSCRQVAKWLAGVHADADHRDHLALTGITNTAGMTGLGFSTLKNELAACFFANQGGVQFTYSEDRAQLKVIGQGNKRQFAVVAGVPRAKG
jgi:hypothetical protein